MVRSPIYEISQEQSTAECEKHTLFVKVFEGKATVKSFVWLDAFRLTVNSK